MANISIAILVVIVLMVAAHFWDIKKSYRRHD